MLSSSELHFLLLHELDRMNSRRMTFTKQFPKALLALLAQFGCNSLQILRCVALHDLIAPLLNPLLFSFRIFCG